MKGYPQYIATKQDYLNLLSMPEYRAQAIISLKAIRDLADDKASRTLSIDPETNEAVVEEIDNPMPLWRIKGFGSRQEVADLIAEEEVHNG